MNIAKLSKPSIASAHFTTSMATLVNPPTNASTETGPEINTLLNRIPLEYLRDFAFDLAKTALITPSQPNAIPQLIAEWEVTLEEIEVAGDELSDILQARQDVQQGIGMTVDELRAYL